MPYDCRIIFVEQSDGAVSLPSFVHFERAVYVLGAEDGGIPLDIMDAYPRYQRLAIDTAYCLNVAVAGSIIMYDRAAKEK